MSDGEFEEIVSQLDDFPRYEKVEGLVAFNALLHPGYMVGETDGKVIIITLLLEDCEHTLDIGIRPDSPLGRAILSGDFSDRYAESLDTIS